MAVGTKHSRKYANVHNVFKVLNEKATNIAV